MGLLAIPNCFVENALQIPLRQGRAFQIFLRLDLLGYYHGLPKLDRGHFLLPEALFGGLVLSEIQLSADQYDGDAGRVVVDFWVPLYSSQSCASLASLVAVVPWP